MGRELILLTGATGFIGFKVLVRALESGYAVRCVVSGPDDLKKILAAPSFKALNVKDNQLFWTLILDVTVPGAFKEALRGVKYVLHCAAAPSNVNNLGATFTGYDPHAALKGVANLLESAHTATRCKPSILNSLKRIIITTSIADMAVDGDYDIGEGSREAAPGSADFDFDGTSAPAQPAPSRPGLNPSPAGKTSTLHVSREWAIKHRPVFDLIFLLPSWVLGHHELAASPSELERGPNGPLIRLLKGATSGQAVLERGFVSVRDVADAHMAVLGADVTGNSAFILSSQVAWQGAQAIARQQFPKAFQKGFFRTDGRQLRTQRPPSPDKEVNLLRLNYQPFDETVIEVAGQYLKATEKI